MYVAVITRLLRGCHLHAFYEVLANILVNLFTLLNPQLQVKMLLELIYQLMPPLGASEQHAKLVTAKKNVIMGQSAYMNQLASIVALTVQVSFRGL